ncbi:MAG: hypothetical protein ACYDCL_03330 [Myxococcales bacterium]
MVFYNVVKKLVAGLAAVIPTATKLTLNGVAYTGASLVAALTSYVALYDSVAASKHQYQVAVKQLKAATPGIRQLVAALGSYLRGQLGAGNPELVQLGLKTGARKPTKALVKAEAQATALATKKVRGILGKQERAKIPAAPKVTAQLNGSSGSPAQNNGPAAPSAPAGGGAGANAT